MKVTYLGPKGSYTSMIAEKLFFDEELIPMQPISRVVDGVERGMAERAVVPLENFYNGIVTQTIDALLRCDKAKIVGETYSKIEHCLGALPGHSRIEKILSKDQALEQCSDYLSKNYADVFAVPVDSTSAAVEIIRRENMLNAAAIASKEALQNSQFEIIEENICPNNKTRFAIIGEGLTAPTGNDKTLLAIHPPMDRVGILNEIVTRISRHCINMEYIQSRPDGNGGYRFIVEIDKHAQDSSLSIIGDELANRWKSKDRKFIKVLGSYKDRGWKNAD